MGRECQSRGLATPSGPKASQGGHPLHMLVNGSSLPDTYVSAGLPFSAIISSLRGLLPAGQEKHLIPREALTSRTALCSSAAARVPALE